MTDHELLNDYRQSLRETIDFYGNSNKPARDLWVVGHFLNYSGISFQPGEVISSVPDPPDVRFRHIDFEVKEILDEGRARHAEYKQKLLAAEQATKYSDLLEGYAPSDLSISQIASLLLQHLSKHSEHYSGGFRRSCNIIFYVNLQRRFFKSSGQWPLKTPFEPFGWRSVSFLVGAACGVFYTREDAPEFLKQMVGRLSVAEHVEQLE